MSSISFIHRGGAQMASYRYRAVMPARSLGIEINEPNADILIFAKPLPGDLELAEAVKLAGKKVIVDICDDHLNDSLYQSMLALADKVTVSTPELAKLIPGVSVVPDSYEFAEREPHCKGRNLLWFGHKVNRDSIERLGIECRKVSNFPGSIPWSIGNVKYELSLADIVLMPATAPYKSPNRTLEAIRSGCFVAAEPHPALEGFPIWIGDIKEGIEWAATHQTEANQMIAEAQDFIREKYSPAIQAGAWRTVLQELA